MSKKSSDYFCRIAIWSTILTLGLSGCVAQVDSAQVAQVDSAQGVCGDRAKFMAALAKKHQEAPTSIGVTSSGQMIEVLTSANGSWTILVTSPNGVSCIVAAGEAWESIERIALGPEA